jgi:hypothetical protein
MKLLCLVMGSLVFFGTASAKLKSGITSTFDRCSTAEIDPLDQLLVENQLNHLRAQRNFKTINMRDIQQVRIPVYIHVLAKDDTPAGGNVSEEMLLAQIDYLNKTYAAMNISFEVINIERIINNNWYTFSVGEGVIKESLHQGDSLTLNLYTAAPSGGILGWAAFPWTYSSAPKYDGVVIHHETLPGGALKEYNIGGTTAHEVGHWLGLYHTFQGGCSDGDLVSDTPAQTTTFGCPATPTDTCESEGLDPINNFMSYSDDVCLTEFTHGQIQRIHDNLASFRN